MNNNTKDLKYYKNKVGLLDYLDTPTSVLKYISELEKAISVTRCCETLKDKQPITFGRYCATRGYHKFEGVWVNRQKFPRDIEWIKAKYRKEIFDL